MDASIIIPAKNESDYLPATLTSVFDMEVESDFEVIVVDGASDDDTRSIVRSSPAKLVCGAGNGIGAGRHLGAQQACGEWLAFVDADTIVVPDYLDAMLHFARSHELLAASSRCRMDGWRSLPMQATINHVFPRMRYPILPGFNFVIEKAVYDAVGGFQNISNEDTALSRRVAKQGPVGYHPAALVHTSARRIRTHGLIGTLYHYLRLDIARLRAQRQ